MVRDATWFAEAIDRLARSKFGRVLWILEESMDDIDEDDWQDSTLEDEPDPPLYVPDAPTEYGPGHPEKVRILAERFEKRQELWCSADAGTCTTLPESVEGKTYVQAMLGLSLRTHDGAQDYYVSVSRVGVKIVKRFGIHQYDEAVEFLHRVNEKCAVTLVDYQLGDLSERAKEVIEELLEVK